MLLFVPLAATVAYVLLFALAGRHATTPTFPTPARWPRLAVYIPAYKEDAVIVDTVRQATAHEYPGSFDVVVIADSMQPSTLDALRALPVRVVEVDFEASTKAKALNAALDKTAGTGYDGAVVLDADNVMAPGFLVEVGKALASGVSVVQGRRVAKNHEPGIATLDGISEAINNTIFRRGHQALGLSAALIGSGMAFDDVLFRTVMPTVEAVGGFDKELELRLLRAGYTIAYLDEARVYDEKVRAGDTFVKQRRRWIAAQVHYVRYALPDALWRLVTRGTVDYADKALQMLLPPRAVLIGLLPLLGSGYFVLGYAGWALAYMGLTAALFIALVLALPTDRPDLRLGPAIGHLPHGVFLMMAALIRSPGGNRTFLHTPHGPSNKDAPSS
jgi:cellulose synthase/poly-beta-1,6-N-acetylglucosamine synthase-like glycosyltransferase